MELFVGDGEEKQLRIGAELDEGAGLYWGAGWLVGVMAGWSFGFPKRKSQTNKLNHLWKEGSDLPFWDTQKCLFPSCFGESKQTNFKRDFKITLFIERKWVISVRMKKSESENGLILKK